MGRHRECKPHVHSARVPFYRCIEKFFDLGKIDDLIKLAFNLSLGHSENSAIQEDVFTSSQLGMKSGADLKKRSDSSANADLSLGWIGYSRKDLEQRRLSSAIPADDAEDFAALDSKADAFECPEVFARHLCLLPITAKE